MKQSEERVNCPYITYLHITVTHPHRPHEKASLPTAYPAQMQDAPSVENKVGKWLLGGLALRGGGQVATWGSAKEKM